MIDLSSLALLKGSKALVTGIANDQSIAWGCAKAFRAFGADLAVTYLNDKAKPHVEPLAKDVDASIFMPLDVQAQGQLEAVFARIEKEWGKLDICLHSIAFAPKQDLQGRVVDCSKEGFLLAHGCLVLVVHPHGQAVRAADEEMVARDLAGPLETRAASGITEFETLLQKAQAKAPARSLVSIDDVGVAVAFLAMNGAKLITGETLYIDGGYHIID